MAGIAICTEIERPALFIHLTYLGLLAYSTALFYKKLFVFEKPDAKNI